MFYPKISIITPSYNQVAYLEDTILSVLNQNYPNLEYIILDGGSTDGSLDIIKKYQDNFSFWTSKKDNGLYDAIYRGIEMATGDIIGWINSDDMYLPNSFFTVSEIFTEFKEIQWVQGNNSHLDEKSRIISSLPSPYWTKYDFAIGLRRTVQQESTFFRKALWINSEKEFLKTSLLAGDYGLWLAFSQNADLYVTTALIGLFRMRSSNQKSLTHREDYLVEKKELYYKSKSHFKLSKIKYSLYWLASKTRFFYFLRFIRMERLVKQIIFNGPKLISFNRSKQKFILFD